MAPLLGRLRHVGRRVEGAAILEYALLLSLFVILCLIVVAGLGSSISGLLTSVTSRIDTPAMAGGGGGGGGGAAAPDPSSAGGGPGAANPTSVGVSGKPAHDSSDTD